MADEDCHIIDLRIKKLLARLNNYIQDLDENINLEEINMAKLFKKLIEQLEGLWTHLHSYTARGSLLQVVREKIDAAEQWLIQRRPFPDLENLDAHLGRFIENKDARFNKIQINVGKQFKEIVERLEGWPVDFSQVEHAMVLYMKYWLEKINDTAEIIKKSSSSMPGKDHNQIDDLETEILVSQQDHYNTSLYKDLDLEGVVIGRMFMRKILVLESHGPVLQPPGRDHNFEEKVQEMIHLVRCWDQTIDTGDTKEIQRRIASVEQWLFQRIPAPFLENLEAHLGHLIQNKDTRINELQIQSAKLFREIIIRLQVRHVDFSQVDLPMVLYMMYWLQRIDNGKNYNQIETTLVSQQDHYNTKLSTMEGMAVARMFQRKILELESHGAVLQPAGIDHNFEEEIRNTVDAVRRRLKKMTEETSKRRREGMSSSQILITRKIFRVLVVDHDSDYLIVHCLQLILFGKMMKLEMKVKAASHGNEAVDLIRDGASFDLIIMDLHSSTNGVEATKELRALNVQSTIIGVIPSTSEPPQQQVFRGARLEYCFKKPLRADVIAYFLL